MKPRTPFHELIPPWRTSLFIAVSAILLLALVPGILAIPAAQSPDMSVVATESQGYTIPAHVVAAGGGQRSSTSYTIWDTAGQAAYFAPMQSNNYQVLAGYWHRLPISVVPNAPTLYGISNPDEDGDYLIDWSDVADATGYTVQEDSSGSFSTPSIIYQGSSSEYAVTDQTVGTWYYRVQASTASGDTPWSNVESVVVGDEPVDLIPVSIWANSDFEEITPASPILSPVLNTDGDGDYVVEWTEVLGAESYTLEEDDSEDFTSSTLRYQGEEKQYHVLGQEIGTWYYRVRASNLGGDSLWSATQPVTVTTTSLLQYVYLPVVLGRVAGTHAQSTDTRSAQQAPTAQELVIQYLESHGYQADNVSTESPIVFASLPSDLIMDLQAQGFVAAVTLQNEASPCLSSAVRTAAAHMTWPRGITGSGIKVAVVEGDGVAFDNPYIEGSEYYSFAEPNVGDHATRVAGAIASSHPEYRGVAYDAEILSANAGNYTDDLLIVASDWAIRRGAHILNLSLGVPCDGTEIASLDKYYDWVVWSKRRTVVAAAGNTQDSCPGNYNVTTPAKGYNVITVGSKYDNNTASVPSDVNDDTFSSFSCYADPTTQSENRMKPEVIATGQGIKSTKAWLPWIDLLEQQGTSLAAPIVAGEAALMMQRADWLKDSPEAVKAGIMTSARWTELKDSDGTCCVSEDKMGVGAVDTTAADNSLINDRIKGLTLRESDFGSGHYDLHFDALQDQRIRVVIVWGSHPERDGWTTWILNDSLVSDFDMVAISPSGATWGSFAHERNYEIVDFVAPETGQYEIQLIRNRLDTSGEERLGFAWYSGDPLPQQLVVTTMEPGFPEIAEPWEEGLDFAKALVAQTTGLRASSLQVAGQNKITYELVGETIYCIKLWDTANQTLHTVMLNESLEVINEDDVQEREMEAYIAKYGKLQKELYDLIQAQSSKMTQTDDQ